MYQVIGNPRTRAFRVMWMLEELGEAYDVDPRSPRDASLEALNPTLKVPVLRDGDAHIVDSVAICQYLADKHGKFTATAGTIARAHQDSFTQFAMDDIEGPLWTLAKHTFALPPEYRVADVKRACEFDFGRALKAFSARLGDRPYVTGETFAVPDLLLGHCLAWGEKVGFKSDQENVLAYLARILARPAFAAADARRKALT